jgi:MFS family permease
MIPTSSDLENNKTHLLHYSPTKGLKPTNIYFGIGVKRGVTFWNLLSMPFGFFIVMQAVHFLNAQFVFLLRDPRYFNVAPDVIGSTASDVYFYQLLISTFFVLLVGQISDIFGRRRTMVTSLAGVAIFLFLIPFAIPDVYPWLIVIRVGFGICTLA